MNTVDKSASSCLSPHQAEAEDGEELEDVKSLFNNLQCSYFLDWSLILHV